MTQIVDPAVISAIDAVKATATAVKANLVERDEVIDMALASLVAETNMFLCGQPGIAKSAVFGDLFKRIDGARKGFYALTKASVPDMLVGPVSLKALTESDRIRHNTDDMLPDVHLAFIDEVFKGNALTRNHVLTILNERTFYNGGQIEECPLIMAAAASNEYPDTHEDAAFWDRFIVRMHVERIHSRENRRAMIRAGLARGRRFIDQGGTLSLADLQTLAAARRTVVIPDPVFDKLDEILSLLDASDLDAAIGDRRVMESFHLVAASALLDGRAEANVDDLGVLSHILWSAPDTRRDVQRIVYQQINPYMASMSDMLDTIVSAFDELAQFCASGDNGKMPDSGKRLAQQGTFAKAAEEQLRNMRQIINEMAKQGRDTTAANEMLWKGKGLYDQSRDIAFPSDPLDFEQTA